MTHLEQTREAWETQAHAYDQALTSIDMLAAEHALRLAEVGAGTRLLDIAAGGGAVSVPAARLGADVLAVDYSNAMVELLGQRAQQMGLANLQVRMMDGMNLELDDDSFDVACSELGIMLFPDRARGLSEMVRVVRPGGRGVMISLGSPQRVEPVGLFLQAMARTIAGFAPPRNSPLFCLQDPKVLKTEMQEAGFADIHTAPFETTMTVESGGELWEKLMAGAPAIAGMMQSVSEEGRREARGVLDDIVRSRSNGAGRAELAIGFNIGVGVK